MRNLITLRLTLASGSRVDGPLRELDVFSFAYMYKMKRAHLINQNWKISLKGAEIIILLDR